MKAPSHTNYININRNSDARHRPQAYPFNTIHYVEKGHGYLKLQNQIFPISEGQTFFIPSGSNAGYWPESEEWSYIWLNFDDELLCEIIKKTAFAAETPVCETTEEQVQFFLDILELKWKLRNGRRYQTIGLTIQLLASYIETYPSANHLMEDSSFQSILNFVHSNLTRHDLSIGLLVQTTGLSRSTLHKRFQQHVGCTPIQYINQRRLCKARHILYTTDLPISYVSKSVGFEDQLYFSRIFKKYSGHSPTEFRHKCRQHDKDNQK